MTSEERDMATRTKRHKRRGGSAARGGGSPIKAQLAQLKSLVRDLESTLHRMDHDNSPSTRRERLTAAINKAHALLRKALGKVRGIEVEDKVARMPEPDADGY